MSCINLSSRNHGPNPVVYYKRELSICIRGVGFWCRPHFHRPLPWVLAGASIFTSGSFFGKIKLVGWGDTRELQVCCHTQQCDHSLIFDEKFLGRTISLNLLHSQSCVRQGFGYVSQLPNLRKCHPLDTFGRISSEIGGQKSNVYLLLAISSRCRARWNHVLKVPYGLFTNFNFAETDKLPVQ